MKMLTPSFRRLSALHLLGSMVAWAAIPASAQPSQVPDMTQFGFPQVAATVNFTPGQATTLTAGNQQVAIAADFLTVPAKFEFVEGDPASFASKLPSDAQGKPVLLAFA